MITLYQFQPALGSYNASPFCLKLETYLKMAGLPYTVASDADVRKAPKLKLPYITDGDRTIADSSFIIDYLKQTYGDSLDQDLSLPEKGIALAFQRLMEDNLYWVVLYSRWVEEDNWNIIRKVYFSDLPPILSSLLPGVFRRKTLKNLYGHGIGRHSREEVYEIGKRDIKAVGDFLRDKPFLMGDQPTSIDATGYGFVSSLVRVQISSPISDYAKQFENLSAYCDRMEEKYWNES